jgi:YVTN family beta-propeller protein
MDMDQRALATFAALATGFGAAGCPNVRPDPDSIDFNLPDDAYWPDRSTCPGVGDGRVLVTNNFSDTISVLDLATFDVVATVPVGLNPVEREGPHHVAAAPDGEFYYVGISNYVPGSGAGPHGAHGAGTADGHALKIRAADNVTVASARVDRNPGDIRLTPDGTRLLMTHFDLKLINDVLSANPDADVTETYANLTVIDPATMTKLSASPLCPAPHGLLPSADGTEAYAACYGSDQVGWIHFGVAGADAPESVDLFDLAPDAGPPGATRYDPYAVTVSPADGTVWLSCWQTGELRVFDPSTGGVDLARTVLVGGVPGFGAFTSDGATLYVPHAGDDRIARIDPNLDPPVVEEQIDVPAECTTLHAVKILPGETEVAVVCEGNHITPGTIVRLDLATGTFDRIVTVGVFPDDAAVLLPEGGS